MYELIAPFKILGATTTAAVSTSSATSSIGKTSNSAGSVRIVNIGNQTIFVELGAAGVTASTTTSAPILANTEKTFYVKVDVTHIAYIAASAGSNIYFTFGESA